MKVNVHGIEKENSRKQKMKWKFQRELPERLIEDCETLADLEHKKSIFDSVSRWKNKPRKTEKEKEILFEEKAAGII